MDKQYWQEMGRHYDAEIFSVVDQDRKGIVRKYIHDAGSEKALATDFGCGIGNFLPLLAEEFGQVQAVDLSETCLQKAQQVCAQKENVFFYQEDLTVSNALAECEPAQFGLCVNAMMMPDEQQRLQFIKNLSKGLQPGAHLLLVVPALESYHYVMFRLHHLNVNRGIAAGESVSALESSLPQSKRHAVNGVYPLDGIATKHYSAEELHVLLDKFGFSVGSLEKVEYDWSTECDQPPASFQEPYPWDWMVFARKR